MTMHLLMIVMKKIAKLLDDVDSQLEIIKNKGVVSDEKYTEYATALSD